MWIQSNSGKPQHLRVVAIPSQASSCSALMSWPPPRSKRQEEEGVETLRLRPKADIHGQEKVQATNRKGGESHRSKKIRWGESPVRVRVPPPAVSYFFALLPVAAGFNVCR